MQMRWKWLTGGRMRGVSRGGATVYVNFGRVGAGAPGPPSPREVRGIRQCPLLLAGSPWVRNSQAPKKGIHAHTDRQAWRGPHRTIADTYSCHHRTTTGPCQPTVVTCKVGLRGLTCMNMWLWVNMISVLCKKWSCESCLVPCCVYLSFPRQLKWLPIQHQRRFNIT